METLRERERFGTDAHTHSIPGSSSDEARPAILGNVF
jgi:hypothetical protein